ncbi:UNVERIFIED_CONTAM: hypothetical protein FKN15_010218 [Acipenser sinensis]
MAAAVGRSVVFVTGNAKKLEEVRTANSDSEGQGEGTGREDRERGPGERTGRGDRERGPGDRGTGVSVTGALPCKCSVCNHQHSALYAELPKEVKNSISHRYRAVKAMADNFIQHCDDPDSGSQSS